MNSVANKNVFFRIVQRLKSGSCSLVKAPPFYIYLISLVIYLPWLLPNLSNIGAWDETYYIISGRGLLSGQLTSLAYGPLLSFTAMISSLPFMGSPFWLIHANSLSRLILFSLLFVGTWQVGKSLKDHFNPIILFGFLFLTPILTQSFEYPADLLFGAISAIAFAQAVNYLKTRQIRHVWWASFWLGLGMLTRGDALIIMGALSVFVLWLGWKHHKWWRLVMAALIPFLALSVGYVLIRGVVTGDFDTGMAHRSYTAFEQGQEIDMPESPGRFSAPTESYYVARELFGTPEENDYSVFTAIRRNPQAYLSRLINVLRSLPGLLLTAYYRRYTIFLIFLAIRGLIALIQQKKIPLAILHLIWVLPLSAGIARTLVRVGYFRLFFFVMFSLAVIGLKALLNNLNKTKEGLVWAGLMGIVLILSLRLDDYAIQFGMTVFLCWLLLAYLLAKRSTKYPDWQYMAILLLLAAGILMTGSFLIYSPRVLGEQTQEKASLVLREFTDPDDYVLTCTPSVVFLADRNVANFCSANIPEFQTSEDFITWMTAQDFDAIYLDSASPTVLRDLSIEQRGKALRQVYSSDEWDAYIFLLNKGD
jgi:hypothetical protein